MKIGNLNSLKNMFAKKVGVGLYFGSKSCCIIQVERTPNGNRVKKYGEVTLPLSKPGETLSEIEDRKVAAIKELLQESGITQREVVTSLPGKEVMVRYFQVPPMPKKELEMAIKFEARRHIPYKIDELVYDFHILKKKSGEKKLKVLFVGTRNEVLKSHLSLVTRAGLDPIAVDINASALGRILHELVDLHSVPATIVLSVNPEMADITVVKDGVIHLSQDISSLIVRASNIKESLLGEIRLFINFCRRELGLEQVDKTFLLGDRDFFEGWDEFLSKELNIPVEIINPPISGMHTELTSWGMLIASGLAIRDVTFTGVSIDLGRSILGIRQKVSAVKKVVLVETIVSFLLLNLLFWPTRSKLGVLKAELAEKKRKALELQMETKNLYELQEIRDKTVFQRNILRAFLEGKGYWPEKLTILANVWPKNAWLTEFTVRNSLDVQSKGNQETQLVLSTSKSFQIIGSMLPAQEDEIRLINNLANSLKSNASFSAGFSDIKVSDIKKGMMGTRHVTRFIIECSSVPKE